MFFYSCSKDTPVPVEEISRGPSFVQLKVPENFMKPAEMASNPLTQEGIALGKKLFFDGILSRNGKVSCATCHQPQKAFADGEALGHLGVSGKTLHRHVPALINMAWQNNGLFWDGGSKNLESLVFGPITHADEMGMVLADIPPLLAADPVYADLFKGAFSNGITVENVAKALAQYQRTLISADSRYDRWVRKEGALLSEVEMHGLQLVREHCAACHNGELFTDNLFHNNGLDDSWEDDSHERLFMGRYRVTNDRADMGKYKTPTLRNVARSAPYMHDGRFATLGEVLEHYRRGMKESEYIDGSLFQNKGNLGIPIGEEEKEAILAFLHTLTDDEFLNEK